MGRSSQMKMRVWSKRGIRLVCSRTTEEARAAAHQGGGVLGGVSGFQLGALESITGRSGGWLSTGSESHQEAGGRRSKSSAF
jgi:hypothetical protein